MSEAHKSLAVIQHMICQRVFGRPATLTKAYREMYATAEALDTRLAETTDRLNAVIAENAELRRQLEEAKKIQSALDDPDFVGLRSEDHPIADTGDWDTTWIVDGYRDGEYDVTQVGYGKTPKEALLDSIKNVNDPSKWDYVPDDDKEEVRGE